MFICSCRASTVKFFSVTAVALAALVTLLVFIPSADTETDTPTASQSVRYDKIKTAEDRIAFLGSLGIEVEAEPLEDVEVTVPAEFDKVYKSYNELQLEQGFDLTKYHRKKVKRYTYRVTNYKGYEGEVLVNLLIYKKVWG